jgi:hypothetical protein
MRKLPPRPGQKKPFITNTGPVLFSIKPWDGSKSGEKIILYAESGMGKTTLSSMAPNPVFIGLDDGGRKILHPQTREPLNYIAKADGSMPDTFEEVRAATQACLDMDCETLVVDTGTLYETKGEDFVLRTVPGPQNSKAVNMESFGYGKGYKHLYDAMKLPLLDFDKLVAAGKNVIIICQSVNNKVANPAGEDFLRDEPRLYHSRQYSVLLAWCEWADHILRIAYQGTWVNKKNKQDQFGKATGDTTRIIQTKEEVYYKAKSRTLNEPVISFANTDDDSLWRLMFPSKYE